MPFRTNELFVNMPDFKELSYNSHKEHYKDNPDILGRLERKNSIDYWRHERMYRLLTPFLEERSSKWLTVGDGLGTDANWLQENGQDVVASDISEYGLRPASTNGYIREYRLINAEDIDYSDNTFDYVFCKEAYHHFPRPYLAVYEMLRVASKAVILIEPVDIGIQFPLMVFLKNLLEKIAPGMVNKVWTNRFSFETVGNYVYKVSEREIEKIAMGIGLPMVAFKGINDFYTTKFDLKSSTENRKIFRKVKSKIRVKNLLCRLGIIPYELEACVIFKHQPSAEILAGMKGQGFKVLVLPENPYLEEK
ncbi:class I SAM-dependent methyltransferase [Marinilabilia salmonicolor]|uniref:class I SAM-dependent methyltransferase n=2 Tax=Marinilabilia salmonicolor TaxID=989 RepID=UPI00029A4CE8|nr:class I SAM-dependent methyltransferase [Marinilabilia salmonicolor]